MVVMLNAVKNTMVNKFVIVKRVLEISPQNIYTVRQFFSFKICLIKSPTSEIFIM